jgi:uncharacterized integral membrane protein
MVIAGAVLAAVAVVVIAAAVTGNSHRVKFDFFGIYHSHLSIGAVFISGMITTVIAVLGVVLLVGGLRRTRKQRKEQKRLEKENANLPQINPSGGIDFTKPIDFDKLGRTDTSTRPPN